jgi:hypothetical protein
MSKKGFELQFNWIFVLIAGAILLSFFFLVIRNQVSSAKVGDASKAQADIDFILRGSLGSRSSEKTVPVGGRIDFSCDDGASRYIVEGSQQRSQYNYLAIFSPKILDSQELVIRTESFKAPFNVMPFTYLSNQHIQYVFVGNDDASKRLFYALPENASKSFLSTGLDNMDDKNFDTLILVSNISDFISSVSPYKLTKFQTVRYEDVFLVVYGYAGGIEGSYGSVDFYNFTDTGFNLMGSSYFFTFEQLAGAVYSGEYGIYSCQFDKSLKRLGMLSELQSQRAAMLSGQFPFLPGCTAIYGNIDQELKIIIGDTKMPVDNAVVGSIFQSVQAIKILNDQLVDMTTCAPIY